MGHASPLDGKAIAETDSIYRMAARIAELEKKIEDHNKECDQMCESRDCDPRYRRPGRSCPDCYKDWKVE